jgi:hypothetical protein
LLLHLVRAGLPGYAKDMSQTARGHYASLLGGQLNTGDYIRVHGEWYRLDEEAPAPSRHTRKFIGRDKSDGRRTCLVYTSSTFKAWKRQGDDCK